MHPHLFSYDKSMHMLVADVNIVYRHVEIENIISHGRADKTEKEKAINKLALKLIYETGFPDKNADSDLLNF